MSKNVAIDYRNNQVHVWTEATMMNYDLELKEIDQGNLMSNSI